MANNDCLKEFPRNIKFTFVFTFKTKEAFIKDISAETLTEIKDSLVDDLKTHFNNQRITYEIKEVLDMYNDVSFDVEGYFNES